MRWSYNNKKLVLGLSFASLVFTGFLFARMGGEFVPTLDEGDFVIQPVLKTGTSLSKTVELTTQMEKILKENFPEVDQIVCRIGAAEVPTDPMSMEEIDMIIKLKPKKKWVSAKTKEELADKFKEALMVIPGIDYEFTQPIEMRFNELITGVRADIAVKIFGEDLDYLNLKAIEIKKLIEKVPGAADVILEKTVGLPQISVTYNREKISFYGLNIEELNQQLTMAFGGAIAGVIFEGEKRFDLVVRLQDSFRSDIENIRMLSIRLPNGNQIPLNELAEIDYNTGPAKISRENTHRRVVVSVNVRNRDLESVIKDVQHEIGKNVKLDPGTYISYGGQFENLKNATQRLKIAVPVALLLIFIFLHFAFKSIKDAILIFTAVPLSTVGGVFLLWIRGMPFSVSAGIGFIALFGVAVLNGIVLIEHLKDLKEKGMTDMHELIFKATNERLRPVLLTAAAAALGFLPMAISTSSGAEVQRPLATVVIGGLITSTMLTMIALPLLFQVFYSGIKIRGRFSKFMRIIKTVIVITLVGQVTNLSAQESSSETQKLTMQQAIDNAIKNNPVTQNAQLSIKGAKMGKQGILNFAPTEFVYQKGQMNSKLIDQSFEINQNFGSLLSHYQSGKLVNKQIKLAENEYSITEQQLEAQVKVAYQYWVYLINTFKIKKEQAKMFKEFERISQAKYNYGESNLLEKVIAETEYSGIKNELLKATEELILAENYLMQLMNINGDFIPENDTLLIYQVVAGSNSEERFTSHLLVSYYENIYEIEKTKHNLEQSKYFPEISAGYFNQEIDNQPGFDGWSIRVSVPIWFLPQNATVQQAKIEREKTMNNLEYQKFNIDKEIENLIVQLDQLQNDLIYYHENALKKADVLIQTAKTQFEKEEIEYFEFLQGIKAAQDIKTGYLSTLYNYNKTAIELEFYTK